LPGGVEFQPGAAVVVPGLAQVFFLDNGSVSE
jgi:hypothetical protein